MARKATVTALAIGIALLGTLAIAHAQQPQIPTLQVCNLTKVGGKAYVQILSRSDAIHSGVFGIRIEVKCDPAGLPYPAGGFESPPQAAALAYGDRGNPTDSPLIAHHLFL